MTKKKFRQILSFAQSKREREVIKYAVFKSSGLSATAARKQLGIEDMSRRVSAVEDALQKAETIRRQIDELCELKEVAVRQSLGLSTSDDSAIFDSSDDDETEQDESWEAEVGAKALTLPLSDVELVKMAKECQCNWFKILNRLSLEFSTCDTGALSYQLYSVLSSALEPTELQLVQQYYDAYFAGNDITST